MTSPHAQPRFPAGPERPRTPLPVTLLCDSGLDSVALAGSCIMFTTVANLAADHGIAGVPGYDLDVVCATEPGTIAAWNGLRMVADRSYHDFTGPVDTFVVPPVAPDSPSLADPALLTWVRRTAARARRVVGFCTGGFLLAAAGLLDGRRATTHWAFVDEFRARFPDVALDPDPIFVRAGNVYTSAGGTAAFDLMLALLEEDYGPEVARLMARYFVLFLQRPGSQAQFSAQLSTQFASRDALRELQAWILDHVDADLSVDALAERVAMSPRNFRRVFRREVGITPARYVERARLEAARRLLETPSATVEGVAAACGFETTETLRNTFLRLLGVTPSAYRRRFTTALRDLEQANTA